MIILFKFFIFTIIFTFFLAFIFLLLNCINYEYYNFLKTYFGIHISTIFYQLNDFLYFILILMIFMFLFIIFL